MNDSVGATLVVAQPGQPQGLPQQIQSRERAIVLLCVFAALAFGAFAALGATQDIATLGLVLIFFVAALILPLSWIALILVALIPLQIYFPFATSLSLRGALIFVMTAALRLLIQRSVTQNLRRWYTWMIPAALFVLAAFIAALGAPNQYGGFKGIYDWLPIFATAFVVSEVVRSERLLRQMIGVLVIGGVGEALLGLVQSRFDVSQVTSALRLPVSGIFFQPNLLRERLSDLSFNWVLDGRVTPFGTFINGIDYAVFLAAILALVLALLVGARSANLSASELETSNSFDGRNATTMALFACALLIGAALLQTLKGSGMIALAGGVIALALLLIPRLSPRRLAIGVIVLVVGVLLVLPFYAEIAQRIIFLAQREMGVSTNTGRTVIWLQLLTYLPQRLFFGWGLNNTAGLVQAIPSMLGGAFVFNFPSAESAYVATLLETGLVGFGALMLFLVVVLWRAYQNVHAARAPALPIGILAALVALLFGNLTVVGLTTDQNGIFLGVLIGMVFAKLN